MREECVRTTYLPKPYRSTLERAPLCWAVMGARLGQQTSSRIVACLARSRSLTFTAVSKTSTSPVLMNSAPTTSAWTTTTSSCGSAGQLSGA